MKTMRTTRLFPTACALALAACGYETPVPPLAGSASGDALPANAAKVSAFDLDDKDFRLNGTRLALQDFMRSQSPVLLIDRPARADHVQVIRCDHRAVIRGSVATLQDIDLGTGSLPEEARLLLLEDFWEAALANRSCARISDGTSESLFRDVSAPTGSFRYLMRACVAKERISDPQLLKGRNCSRLVSLSPALKDFRNERESIESQRLAEAQRLRDLVDELGRKIYLLGGQLQEASLRCTVTEADRVKALQRKEALALLLGSGISLGLTIFSLVPVQATALAEEPVGKGDVFELAASTANQDFVRAVWAASAAAPGFPIPAPSATPGVPQAPGLMSTQAQKIAQVLLWLFASQNDFPRSCTTGVRLTEEGRIATLELKANQELLAVALDAAETARRNRESIQK